MTISVQCGCCLLTPHFLGIAISAGKNRTVCIPFSPNAGNKPPSWQHLRLMYAFRDSDGKILASCVHFQVQSGDLGCVARESCRQGLLFASRCPKSCMAHDSCHGDCPPLRSARGMCRHGPSRAPGETLVSTERIPGQAPFWMACWAVWVSGCCGIVQATFSKLQLQIGGSEFPPVSCCRRNGGTSRAMSGAVFGVLMAPLLFCECFRIYLRFDR